MKIKSFLYSLVLSLTLLVSSLLAAERATIADLEAVLNRASSLQEFLNSTKLQKSYLEVAQRYYGGTEHFPEESYQAILKSFKESLAVIPELADRAWKIRSTREPIVIQSVLKAYGVTPHADEWRSFLQSLGFDLTAPPSPAPLDHAKEKLEAIEAEINAIETSVPQNLSPRRRQAFISAKYKILKDSELVSQTRSTLLQHISRMTSVRSNLVSPYGDVALEAIDQIRNRMHEVLPELSQYTQGLRLVLNSIPQARTLANNRNLFFEEDDFDRIYDSQFQFVDLPRRFHALFRGISHEECVGGDKDLLDSLTPRRYLIPLLDGGHEIYVLKDGNYAGYLSTVAVESNGKHYLSLDVMSAELDKKALIVGTRPHTNFNSRSIFSLWFANESRRTENDTNGYVVGQSYAIDNADGLYAIRTSGPWVEGLNGGVNKDYRTLDPIEASIVALPRPKNMYSNYDVERMIYDLSVKDALQIVRLNPVDFNDGAFDDTHWLNQRFSGTHFTEAMTWVTYSYITPNNSEVETALHDEAWLILEAINQTNHKLHSAALEFLEHCGPPCIEGIFHYSFPAPIASFKRFINGIKWVQAIPHTRRFNLMNDYLDQHIERGVELALQENDPVEAISEIYKSSDSNVPNMGELILTHIEDFISLRPSIESLPQLAAHTHTADEYIEVIRAGLPLVNSPEDYLALVTLPIKRPPKSMRTAAREFVQDTITYFINTRPWPTHWMRLRKLYLDIDVKLPQADLRQTCSELLSRPVF